MRLVDVEALIAEYDRTHEGEAGKARKLMEDAPTVEAIPVEWLKDRIRIFRECGADIMAQSLETEIEWWKVKNRKGKKNEPD